MIDDELAEKIADEALTKWDSSVRGLLRLAIRNDMLLPAIKHALSFEREACAKVVEEAIVPRWLESTADVREDIAGQIRARGAQ